ncbi:MAG: hypothetical protein G4V63_31395 [Candidatus Afipia apatlaquensis]|uniref:Uncharacterized protein n=1 Tax=Candidatus Afipia apatlaquensis TaxID=2712852 RepID=A0A7C9VQY4_9BRAD|nr:hypothetical protein [Candidatus Afipia apatlaquensis]
MVKNKKIVQSARSLIGIPEELHEKDAGANESGGRISLNVSSLNYRYTPRDIHGRLGLAAFLHNPSDQLVILPFLLRIFRYRQHGRNSVGLETTLRSRWGRVRAIFAGGLSAMMDLNVQALQASRAHLTNKSQMVLDDFAAARDAQFATRLYKLWKSGVYRQTLPATYTLWLAAITRKL